MLEIMSCLLFAKLSICASKLIRPPYASYTNLTVYVNILIAVHLSPNTMKIMKCCSKLFWIPYLSNRTKTAKGTSVRLISLLGSLQLYLLSVFHSQHHWNGYENSSVYVKQNRSLNNHRNIIVLQCLLGKNIILVEQKPYKDLSSVIKNSTSTGSIIDTLQNHNSCCSGSQVRRQVVFKTQFLTWWENSDE